MMPHCRHAERLSIRYQQGRLIVCPECCIQDATKWHYDFTNKLSEKLPATLAEFMTKPEYYLSLAANLEDCLKCDCPYAELTDNPCTNHKFIKVDIDGSCNFDCLQCFISKQNRMYDELRRQAQLSCLDWCRQHADTIHLTAAGEPFISGANGYSAHWLLSLQATDRVKTICALSNYSFLEPELLQRLLDHLQQQNKTLYINASCDAFQEDYYTRIRRGGNFQQVIRNMRYAHEHGVLQAINYCFMPWNEVIGDTIGEQLLELGFNPQQHPLLVWLSPDRQTGFNYRNTLLDENVQIINEYFRNCQESLQRCGFDYFVNTVGKKKE